MPAVIMIMKRPRLMGKALGVFSLLAFGAPTAWAQSDTPRFNNTVDGVVAGIDKKKLSRKTPTTGWEWLYVEKNEPEDHEIHIIGESRTITTVYSAKWYDADVYAQLLIPLAKNICGETITTRVGALLKGKKATLKAGACAITQTSHYDDAPGGSGGEQNVTVVFSPRKGIDVAVRPFKLWIGGIEGDQNGAFASEVETVLKARTHEVVWAAPKKGVVDFRVDGKVSRTGLARQTLVNAPDLTFRLTATPISFDAKPASSVVELRSASDKKAIAGVVDDLLRQITPR